MEQKIQYADIENEKIFLAQCPMETIDALYEFGLLLTNEVQQRTAQIDSKLGIYLATSVAVLAVLGTKSTAGWMVYLSGVSAIIAMAISALGLRSLLWAFPSEVAWFNKKAPHDHERLRRTYVLAMLEAHQAQHEDSAAKANKIPAIETLLIMSGSLAALSAIMTH